MVLVVAACGLDRAGLLEGATGDAAPDGAGGLLDAGNDDSATDGGTGGSAGADGSTDAAPDVSPDALDAGCPPGACTDVPTGWTPVAYREGTTTCPTGMTSTVYATKPTPAAGACACGCAATSSISCDVGTSQTYYSANATCSTVGTQRTFSTSGQCLPINSVFGGNYYAATALPPSGGSCSAAPVAGSATATDVVLCSGLCEEAICADLVPTGYSSCIETPGDTTCPPNTPYTQLFSIGDSPSVTCSGGCGCSVTGTCTSPKITYYGDTNCSTVAQAFNADGSCQPVTFGGTLRGVGYSATVTNAGCTPSGTSTPTATLENRRTVCCRP